jgi:hypothetical protein
MGVQIQSDLSRCPGPWGGNLLPSVAVRARLCEDGEVRDV